MNDQIGRLRGSTVEQRFCEPPVAGSTPAAGFLARCAIERRDGRNGHWPLVTMQIGRFLTTIAVLAFIGFSAVVSLLLYFRAF